MFAQNSRWHHLAQFAGAGHGIKSGQRANVIGCAINQNAELFLFFAQGEILSRAAQNNNNIANLAIYCGLNSAEKQQFFASEILLNGNIVF